MKPNQQEPVRRSVVEKRHHPIPTKNSLINSVEISQQNRNQFLNNVEQGSTLRGSRHPASTVGNEENTKRINSAKNGMPIHQHPHHMTHPTGGLINPNYTDTPDGVDSHSINLTTMSLMQPKAIRNSPLNTVFQKLVVQDNNGQSLTQQVSV